MKRLLAFLSLAALTLSAHADPLRVFIRGGKKSHGPNQHEHERFLADWKVLLAERGMKADGALNWPTAEQFRDTDVIIVHAQSGGDTTEEQKALIAEFTKRGGGLVVIHAAAVSNDPPWWKSVVGGTWVPKATKFKEGPMDLYFTENQYLGGGHPITRGAANFHLDDEIYYDLDLAPEVRVLATAYTPKVKEGKKQAEGGRAHIYDIQPQMWTYEKDGYRAVVSIPGHLYGTFALPNYRAILLRSIAWAGQRTNVDEFVKPAEIEALTYPPGGPQKPADTLANLEVHPDFTMKLVAAEPLINKPMNFDWDPAGRMWVVETPEYPNGRRGMRPDYRGKEWKDHGGIDPTPGEQTRKAQDKISILIDTDGDGVADKKQIFYEGLDLATGFVFHKDGVIVTQAPDILWLRDTNGDGVADQVEKLYTNLGTKDTHAVINNPRWGWDGWIYATHGYSGSSNVMNAKGEVQGTIGSGVVRFRPDGSKIEQYSSKGGNTWGLCITGDNRVMWTQPTSGQLLMQTILPEYALARGKIGNTPSFKVVEPSLKTFPLIKYEDLPYVQIDWVGSFTAAAGCAIYDGGTWPAEYHGDYFCTEPTINIIHHARLTPEGSSSTFHKLPGREETEFIRSNDRWWRPIEVRIGPDGAMYVADFYNQAVIHNDTRGPDHNNVNAAVRPDRDHYFGRIWRVDHKQAKKLAVPDLSKAGVAELAKALESPNNSVRMTASRLLGERLGAFRDQEVAGWPSIQAIESKSPETRIANLWTLRATNDLRGRFLQGVLEDKDEDARVRRNAAQVVNEGGALQVKHASEQDFRAALTKQLSDADSTVRIAALMALSTSGFDGNTPRAIVTAWPKLDDDFQRSAAIGAASQDPVAVIAAAFDSTDTAALTPLVSALTPSLDSVTAAKLVVAIAGKPASTDALKRSILEGIAGTVKDAPPETPELSAALGKLLTSSASDAVLPLAAKWDKAGTLKPQVAALTTTLLATLGDTAAPEAARLSAARGLAQLRGSNSAILPALMKSIAGEGSQGFQRAIVGTIAEANDAATGAALTVAYPTLPANVQPAAFDALVKRPAWTTAFLDAVKAKQIDVTKLGPAATSRLRSHPDKGIAKRAVALLDQLNPMVKAKKDALANLLALVEQKGNPAKGKELFTVTCAICHQFGDFGAEIGPGLTGMGAHGPSELLSAIVDPNAEVDPAFTQWNIETKDGAAFAGVIAAENPTTITLKSLAGMQQVKVADIKTRVNTGRSLMPEGFEGLGGETLRDIIAYMQSVDGGRFRTVDLRDAFTASTSTGLYYKQEAKGDSFVFTKTGTVSVEKIPFNIVSADKAPLNILVLKGGPEKSYSKSLPQKVEVKLGGFKANRLHFLGGVAGWGARGHGDGTEVLKVTIHTTQGQREGMTFKNGVEFADYNGRFDVPGSKFAPELLKGGHQLRWFSKPLALGAVEIDRITIESLDNSIAPTLVAITAELADANAAPLGTPEFPGRVGVPPAGSGVSPERTSRTSSDTAPVSAEAKVREGGTPSPAGKMPTLPENNDAGFKPQFTDEVPQPPATRPAKGPRVLLVGGGSSHDFVKFFGGTDKPTLEPTVGWVDFTQNLNGIPTILDRIDVLVLSANQPISSATKKALLDFANAGKGIVALHPGTWYAWKNFPEWNQQIVGGGTRGHDKLGAFPVTITNADHPITKGVTATFEITDELYNYNPNPTATPIEVLATATSPTTGKTFPQVWIVKHPKARIVGLTLGHDARAHDLPEYKALLKNAVQWAAGK